MESSKNRLKNEIDMLNDRDNAVTQAGEYHYSKGKRIFEGWRESKILQSLSLNEKVINVLKMLYKKEPYPFQTITFNYGSNQPFPES